MEENNELINNPAVEYTDDNIRHLSDMEHVRTRPGMYIGKLGDGSHAEDGIYVLFERKLSITVSMNLKCRRVKRLRLLLKKISVSACVIMAGVFRRENSLKLLVC